MISPGNVVALQPDRQQLNDLAAWLAGIPNGMKIALRSAINDTLRSERAGLVRRMGGKHGHLNLPAREVRKKIKLATIASDDNASGKITIRYDMVGLHAFKARWSERGVTVTTVKESGPQVFKHLFKPKGQDAVYARAAFGMARKVPATKGRYAGRTIKRGPRKGEIVMRQRLIKQFGPSVLKALVLAPGLLNQVLDGAQEKLGRRLLSKVQWLLDKRNKSRPAPEQVMADGGGD